MHEADTSLLVRKECPHSPSSLHSLRCHRGPVVHKESPHSFFIAPLEDGGERGSEVGFSRLRPLRAQSGFLIRLRKQRSERMILHEGFHGLVGSQTETVVELGRGVVAVLGTLPEETLVVA